ncbi:DUF1672 family protein [Cytobacillus sp. FSL K6-0265]|uniref:DUF1672 family protein n=2 Tax=Cytobacillus stercorigallinarum TaxID=2762240 RepID=A0ABR8QVY8_9BACI|nr:DUF1672 family protein [Cytobacillus stercorigallinarum]
MVPISKISLCCLGIIIMLGGCSNPTDTSETNASDDALVSVAEYNGEGYALPYGKETDQIAEDHREQIEEATVTLFQENYQTEVVVHNVVGALDAATVFVESVGEPHFYTYAVVPIDEKEKKVMTEQISADAFQVENAIKGGLYHMIFSEEFKKLDNYFESLVAEGEVIGKTEAALKNVGGHGFMTPYYFITLTSKEEAIQPVYDLYLNDSNESVVALRNAYKTDLFDSENFKINIQLFMADKEENPSEAIFHEVTKVLEEMDSIPSGTYSFSLNDHYIDKKSGEGAKENSLKRSFPDYIVKE